jgi:hypothetical protein
MPRVSLQYRKPAPMLWLQTSQEQAKRIRIKRHI